MRTILSYSLAAVAILLAVSCGNSAEQGFKITEDGLDVIKLGMNINDLPESIEGLYDELVVEHQEADDFMGTDAYDYYSFKLNGKEVIKTDKDVSHLSISHPEAYLNGIHPGMSAYEAAKNGAEFVVYGSFESCEFFSWMRLGEAEIYLQRTDFCKTMFTKDFESWLISRPNIEESTPVDVTENTFSEGVYVESIYITK